mgnify:CR=1 FL=1|jgi:hypothetical protein
MEVAIKVGGEVLEIEVEVSKREAHGLDEESEGKGG